MDRRTISTSELKARCAEVIERVARGRTADLITKHGKPVAKLVPLDDKPRELFGFAKGCITTRGDIVEPIEVDWEASG